MSKQPDKAVVTHQIIAASTSWAGPIPSPESLAMLEKAIPGSAARIFDLAEMEAKARIKQTADDHQKVFEKAERESQRHNTSFARGQWMSFVVSLAIVACCVGCCALKCEKAAIVLAGVSLASIISAFLGRSSK